MTPPETADRLIRAIRGAPWFASVGEPLSDAEADDARLYLAAMNRSGTAVARLSDWVEARAVADDPTWDRSWWEAEERIRTELTEHARTLFPEDIVHDALSRIAVAATETVEGAAAIVASRFGNTDRGLIKSAAGAATQACHQAALARIAATAPNHPFEIKIRLFEGGRWPLAIVRGSYYVF